MYANGEIDGLLMSEMICLENEKKLNSTSRKERLDLGEYKTFFVALNILHDFV